MVHPENPQLADSYIPISLSLGEHAVLKLVASGFTNKQIGKALEETDLRNYFLGQHTTPKKILHNIFGKLGVKNRTSAVMEATRRGLISLDVDIQENQRGKIGNER